VRDAPDEVAVHLQEVDREALQVGERRQAAAEVVQREAAAQRAQLVDELDRHAEVGDRHRLGELEADNLGGDPVLGEPRADERQEGLVAEGGARQVDGVEVGPGFGKRPAPGQHPAGPTGQVEQHDLSSAGRRGALAFSRRSWIVRRGVPFG
jgi:hypothetical protein